MQLSAFQGIKLLIDSDSHNLANQPLAGGIGVG